MFFHPLLLRWMMSTLNSMSITSLSLRQLNHISPQNCGLLLPCITLLNLSQLSVNLCFIQTHDLFLTPPGSLPSFKTVCIRWHVRDNHVFETSAVDKILLPVSQRLRQLDDLRFLLSFESLNVSSWFQPSVALAGAPRQNFAFQQRW